MNRQFEYPTVPPIGATSASYNPIGENPRLGRCSFKPQLGLLAAIYPTLSASSQTLLPEVAFQEQMAMAAETLIKE